MLNGNNQDALFRRGNSAVDGKKRVRFTPSFSFRDSRSISVTCRGSRKLIRGELSCDSNGLVFFNGEDKLSIFSYCHSLSEDSSFG